jgi:hypothetical protein
MTSVVSFTNSGIRNNFRNLALGEDLRILRAIINMLTISETNGFINNFRNLAKSMVPSSYSELNLALKATPNSMLKKTFFFTN